MGKSFISSHCNLNKYETDISETLPEKFANNIDIIVVGNRYKFSDAQIISHFVGDKFYVIVEFSKYEG